MLITKYILNLRFVKCYNTVTVLKVKKIEILNNYSLIKYEVENNCRKSDFQNTNTIEIKIRINFYWVTTDTYGSKQFRLVQLSCPYAHILLFT